MSELERADVRSEVYKLENNDQTVASAKSVHATKYDVDYSKLSGTLVGESGWSAGYPRYAVVVEVPE